MIVYNTDWIKTGYVYQEGEQYQEIWFNRKDFRIVRRQNSIGVMGIWIDTEDVFKVGSGDTWEVLFRNYVVPMLNELLGGDHENKY